MYILHTPYKVPVGWIPSTSGALLLCLSLSLSGTAAMWRWGEEREGERERRGREGRNVSSSRQRRSMEEIPMGGIWASSAQQVPHPHHGCKGGTLDDPVDVDILDTVS
jgi:hypothetical protein